jgi:N-acetylglucosaminyldiphosphoundecaprenol N-acetyl-beta-D-mannosaminyltransferase
MNGDGHSAQLFGIAITNRTYEDVCDQLDRHIATGNAGFVVTPNVNHVCLCYRNPVFKEAYQRAFLALPDGIPILWASRLLGVPLKVKLSGSDMVPRLCAFAAEQGYSVFFLGGAPGTADRSAEIMKERHPALKVAGTYCPPFGFEKDPAQLAETLAAVREAAPVFCFVALGSPKQELFMANHHEQLGAQVSIGIGAAFDFISGRVKRAPVWMQHAGLEWLWRLLQEPRRLWRRYLVEDLVFFKILWRELRDQRSTRTQS